MEQKKITTYFPVLNRKRKEREHSVEVRDARETNTGYIKVNAINIDVDHVVMDTEDCGTFYHIYLIVSDCGTFNHICLMVSFIV